jgi:phosphohistidine phosphatase
MKVFVLRHGQAEPYTQNDAGRQLVERGRKEVLQVVQSSLADLQYLAQIWASPYVRAQQTAQLAAGLLGDITIQTQPFLTPDVSPEVLIELLVAVDASSVLLVSHQPLVSRLLERLCDAAPGTYPMDTAALACVNFDTATGLGELVWLRHPVH